MKLISKLTYFVHTVLVARDLVRERHAPERSRARPRVLLRAPRSIEERARAPGGAHGLQRYRVHYALRQDTLPPHRRYITTRRAALGVPAQGESNVADSITHVCLYTRVSEARDRVTSHFLFRDVYTVNPLMTLRPSDKEQHTPYNGHRLN
ncbi:uncharacterized [Tachysurus ichikawai]